MKTSCWVFSFCLTAALCVWARAVDKEEKTSRDISWTERSAGLGEQPAAESAGHEEKPVTTWEPVQASPLLRNDEDSETSIVPDEPECDHSNLHGSRNTHWRHREPRALPGDDIHFQCQFESFILRKDLWPDCPTFCDSPCVTETFASDEKWKNWTIDGCWQRLNSLTCCANLTSVPAIPDNVNCLNFSRNALTILDGETFKNVNTSNLQVLVLNKNDISVINDDALAGMTSLTHFELAYNHRGLNPLRFAAAVNRVPSLQYLALNRTKFHRNRTTHETGLTQLLTSLNLPQLQYLFVDFGLERKLNLSHLAHFTELRVFSMTSHKLQRLTCCKYESRGNATGSVGDGQEGSEDLSDESGRQDDCEEDADENDDDEDEAEAFSANPCKDDDDDHPTASSSRVRRMCGESILPNLMILDLADNSLIHIPCFCCFNGSNGSNSTRGTIVPRLERLSLSLNAVLTPADYQMNCLPELKSLALTGNPLKIIKSRLFQKLPKLCMLDLRFTNVIYVEREAFNHSALRYLTIQSSNWFFNLNHTANMDQDLFVGSNLSFVVLSYNNFREVQTARLEAILAPLQTVEYLYVAEIGLVDIPEVIQRNFLNLKVLGFMSNIMTGFGPDTFSNMKNLRRVELGDNHLTGVSLKAVKDLLKRNIVVDLQANPFSCTCDLRLFVDVFKKYWSRTAPCRDGLPCFEGTEYVCQAPETVKDVGLADVIITEQQCLLTIQQAIIIHALSGIFILAFLFTIALYRYRWQWRYWMYTVHVRWSKHYNSTSSRRLRYNTFVSYCTEDSNFILTSVLPQVERSRRLPLCIHERDFQPGKYFTQNVLERMEESRQVLLVLSNAFLQDDWCRFELFVAHRYGLIHRRLPVTVVQLEPLHVDHMDAHVITLLQATPCLEWPGRHGNARLTDMFWQRLAETLTRNGR